MTHVDRIGVGSVDALTRRFIEVVTGGDLEAPVATCGDWTLADLTWHLTEVQSFWAYAIANRPAGPETYQEPTRPSSEGLVAQLESARARLVGALSAADPADHAWSWSVEQTVAFTLRRQTHEALIHLVDASLAAGVSLPTAAASVWGDGVDEVLSVFLSALPDWGTLAAGDGTFAVHATDTDQRWQFRFGRFVGTEPSSNTSVDLPCLAPYGGANVDATIGGSAEALDLWLWGRPSGDGVEASGDRSVVERLRSLIDTVVQ